MGFSVAAVEQDLEGHIAAVQDIHHVHAWSITDERPMVTLHARIREDADPQATVVAIKTRLAERFGIAHATVETERGECADEQLAFDTDRALRQKTPAH
jgi:cobalt-zinc-cadmium efflux system protein